MTRNSPEETAFSALVRLISVRPRTEAEAVKRLAVKGFPPQVVQRAVDRARQGGLLDDRMFAWMYTEDRLLSRPCSRRLVAAELRSKGVDPGLAETASQNALPEWEEEQLAQRALAERRRLWENLPWETAYRRALAFLLRRGFPRETARRAVAAEWGDEG